MIKVIVTEEFTLGRFNELKSIERANTNKNEDGRLYINDKFECNEDMYEYLTIKNNEHRAFIKIIEIIPDKEEIIEEKPKRRRKSVAQN